MDGVCGLAVFGVFVRPEVASYEYFVTFSKDVERNLEFLVRECDTVHIECIFSNFTADCEGCERLLFIGDDILCKESRELDEIVRFHDVKSLKG